ncbi:MAG: phosphatase PAP2 family protein [Promethearchaeota archaeon]
MSIAEKIKESITAKLLLIIIIPWIILAIVFGFTDLEISKAIVNEESTWGNFGAEYGEAPGYGLIGIGIVILIGCSTEDIKKQKLGAFIVIIITMILFAWGIADNDKELMIYGGFIGIPILIFTIFLYNEDWNKYKTIAAVIVLLAILNPLLFVQITKILAGRVRYRNLETSTIGYTPWWAPPGLSSGLSGNASFPSGHTAMGWMFLPLLIIVKDRDWKDPIKILTWILVIGWGLFVALSRIVVGAHYASDVLFSTGMAALITILLYRKFYLENN